MKTLELVTFKANEGVSDQEIIEKGLGLTAVLDVMPGFLDRQFAKTDDGEWVDAVTWDTKENAEAAAKAVMEIPQAGAFFALIDQSTMAFRHAAIQSPETV